MQFGKSYEDVKNESTSGGSGGWIKWLKKGDTTFRILQEPNEWKAYWEHFNPSGYPFPCTGDKNSCPGCTSSNEKMKSASRKVAFNVLEGEFINVYKVPKTVADKLDNRAQRLGTITDRDYTISRIDSRNSDGSNRVDYDIEGQDKIKVNFDPKDLKDIEAMLAEAYDQSWGDPDKIKQTNQNAKYNQQEQETLAKLKKQQEEQPKDPPSEASFDEADLRKMEPGKLLDLIQSEGKNPEKLQHLESDQIVDWMLVHL